MTDGMDTGRVRVIFELSQDEDGWPPVGVETLWARQCGVDRVEIDNIPFFVRGLSAGDVVRVVADDTGRLHGTEVIVSSDNCTIRVSPSGEGESQEKRQKVLDTFAPTGVDGEGLNRFNLVALNVPASVDLSAVKQILVQGERDGRWYYEEGCVTPEWRALG